jgi:xanthine/uracil permease
MIKTNGDVRTQTGVESTSVSELFQELADQTRTLVSLEVNLAKAELSEKASKMGRSAGFMAAGGFIIYAGFLAIMAAVIIALANVISPWLSALVVGIVVGLIGYSLLRKGMNDLKKESPLPQRTLDSLKRDKEWAQEQMQ